MKRLYFGASQGKSVVSSLIRWFQWGNKNTHVFFIPSDVELNLENPTIIEAWQEPLLSGGAVREGLYQDLHPDNEKFDIYYIKVTDDQFDQFHKNIRTRLGQKYDILGILGFVTKNPRIQSRDKVFCSELLVDELYKIDEMIFRNTPPQVVSPGMFLISPRIYPYIKKTIAELTVMT